MRDEFMNDVALRRFLLGDVDDDERKRIERLFISDPEAGQRIETAEDDLFEDYLENSLTESEREKFLAQYGNTPQQRRRLRIVRSIKEYAVADALARTATSNRRQRSSVLSWLGLHNRMFLIPVAVTLVIALVVGVFWVVRWNAARDQENNRHLAMERELSDLNGPANLRAVPPQLLSLELPPVSLRSTQARTELTPQPDLAVVELKMLWTQTEHYPGYRAVIHQVGKPEQFTILNLQAEHDSSGNFVRVRLPARLLARGVYQVTLSGIKSDGAPDQSEEYNFTVGG